MSIRQEFTEEGGSRILERKIQNHLERAYKLYIHPYTPPPESRDCALSSRCVWVKSLRTTNASNES